METRNEPKVTRHEPTEARRYRLADLIIGEIDKAIKVLSTHPAASRPLPPAPAGDEPPLSEADRAESCRLMRVNHSGEVAAQALYRGQAAGARDPAIATAMRHAAAEELDHLAWCAERLEGLGGRMSLLNPLWYGGSFFIGALAGLRGDRASLGFITETERQVEQHLTQHLERLPAADQRSRQVLEQMRHDEVRHGQTAAALGGETLPAPLRLAMRLTSQFMTRGSYWM
jgi:ubiquinone biosynthesis monooxygenase Coq7